MTWADQLKILRSASPLSLATAAAKVTPYAPWSTGHALYRDATGQGHKDSIPQAVSTDVGRGIGGALGGLNAKWLTQHWGTEGSPLLRSAIVLGGTGVGALLGNMKGRDVGQELFPGTLKDRLQRAANNF